VDDIARGEVLTGRLIGAFGELADQLLEDDAHAPVADVIRAQALNGKALHHLVEQVGVVQLLDKVLELEVLEDLACVLAEGLDIAHQVGGGLGIGQGFQRQPRGIEELVAGRAQQQLLAHGIGLAAVLACLRQHNVLGRRQHAFHAAQQRERQDDAPVLRLLEVAPQQVGNGPEEGSRLGVIFRIHAGSSGLLQNSNCNRIGDCPAAASVAEAAGPTARQRLPLQRT